MSWRLPMMITGYVLAAWVAGSDGNVLSLVLIIVVAWAAWLLLWRES